VLGPALSSGEGRGERKGKGEERDGGRFSPRGRDDEERERGKGNLLVLPHPQRGSEGGEMAIR